jgi:hypothetical protein
MGKDTRGKTKQKAYASEAATRDTIDSSGLVSRGSPAHSLREGGRERAMEGERRKKGMVCKMACAQ